MPSRVESQLLRLRLQPQQAGAQSAADQLADMLTCCNIGTQMVWCLAALSHCTISSMHDKEHFEAGKILNTSVTVQVQPEAAEQNQPMPGLDLQLQHLQLQSHPPPLEQNQQPLLMVRGCFTAAVCKQHPGLSESVIAG